MNILFVTDIAPNVKHVSGKRIYGFAREFSRLGHSVYVLIPSGIISFRLGRLSPEKININFRRDTDIDTALYTLYKSILRAGSKSKMPILRKFSTLLSILTLGGTVYQWFRVSEYTKIVSKLEPIDWVIGGFGNTHNLILCRRIANATGSYVAYDVKDPWSSFVPFGLRHYIAWTLRGADLLVTISDAHGQDIKKYFTPKTLYTIYTGLHDPEAGSTETIRPRTEYDLFIFGSLYNKSDFSKLLHSLARGRSDLRIAYAGMDDLGDDNKSPPTSEYTLIRFPYQSEKMLARLAQRCRFILFYQNVAALYQDKFLLMLSFRRPIITDRPLSTEYRRIADDLCGHVIELGDESGMHTFDWNSVEGFTADLPRVNLENYTVTEMSRKYLKGLMAPTILGQGKRSYNWKIKR